MSASVNLPLHHKVQKFSSGTGSLGWSGKKGRKTVVVVCGGSTEVILVFILYCFPLQLATFALVYFTRKRNLFVDLILCSVVSKRVIF